MPTDPDLTETDLADAFDQLTPLTPDRESFLAGLDARVRRDRRRRRTVVGWGATSVIAVAVVALVFGLGSPVGRDAVPVQTPAVSVPSAAPTSLEGPRKDDVWAMVHRTTPPRGWRVTSRYVTSTSDGTRLVQSAGAGECDVSFEGPGAVGAPDGLPRATLAGRRGFLSAGEFSAFYWSYARNAWASVSCGLADDSTELKSTKLIEMVLPGVTEQRQSLQVPLTLAPLPSGLSIFGVTQNGGSTVGSGISVDDVRREPGLHAVEVTVDRIPAAAAGTARSEISVGGRAAVLGIDQPVTNGSAWLCLTPAAGTDLTICARNQASPRGMGTPGSEAEIRGRLVDVMSRVSPAADLSDGVGWPGASQLPG